MEQSEKQKYFSENFGQYHLDILEDLDRRYSLKDKVIIDVGGSNIPAEVMQLFGVKKFFCLDPVSRWYTEFHSETPVDNFEAPKIYKKKNLYKKEKFQEVFEKEFCFIVDEDIENVTVDMFEFFDVVFSISTFEHVTSLEKTLRIIYDLLKPGGIVYSQYEPIFSCATGHHVWINELFNFNTMPEIDHMHLLYTKDEAKSFLETIGRFSPEIRENILDMAYDSKFINRFTLTDHIFAFQNAPFIRYEILYWKLQPVPEKTLELLCKKHGSMRYDVRGIRYVAFK